MQFGSPGTYNVKVKTTDDCGKLTSSTRTVIVKDKPVKLYFETNGGTTINPISIEKGETYTLSNVSTTKSNWLFDGWYNNPALAGDPITTILMDEDKTVYAKWVEDRYKTYVFNNINNVKTLAINVPETQLETYKENYGNIVATYRPWDEEEEYIFNSIGDQLWGSYRTQIKRVVVGSDITPTRMEHWFSGFSILEEFDASAILRISTAELTSMNSCFKNCEKLDHVDLSSWTTPKLEILQSCFQGCKAFNDWQLGFNTKWVTDFSFMFADTKARNTNSSYVVDMVNYIDVTDFNFSQATTLSYMFAFSDCDEIYFCKHFAQADDMRQVSSFNSMFSNTKARAIFSRDFTFGSQTITDTFMFGNAVNLEGGAGTVFDEPNVDKSYAHIDGGTANPGYFRGQIAVEITYNVNGGEPITPATKAYKTGDVVALERTTKTDKQLEGWYKDSALTEKAGDGFNYRVSESETLYANWIDPQPEKTHYLFADNTLVLGVPEAELDYQKSIHGNVIHVYENDPTATDSIFSGEINRIEHVLCGAPKVCLVPTKEAFKGFIYLLDASVSNLVGDPNVDNGRLDLTGMFDSCGNLGHCEAEIDGTISAIKSTSKMFYQCFHLNRVKVPKAVITGDGMSESCDYMFGSCRELGPTLDLSNMEFDYVLKMNHMFHECYALKEITFPEFMNTEYAEEMQYMFAECTGLERIHNSRGLNTHRTKYLTGMFKDTKIEEIDLTGVDTYSALSVSGMFNNCTELRTIYASEEFIMRPQITSTNNLFANCSNLVGQNGTHWFSSMASDGNMMHIDGYDGIDGLLTKGVLPYAYAEYNDVSKELRFFRGTFDKYQDGEIIGDKRYFTEIEQTTNWQVRWPANIPRDCVRVVTDGNHFKLRGAIAMFENFANCSSVELQNFEYHGDTMERMFDGCAKLADVTFGPYWDVSDVTNMNRMFYGCRLLTRGDFEFIFTGWAPNMLKYAQAMFLSCDNTDRLDLSAWNLSFLKNAEEMFAYMGSLRTIYVDASKTFDLDEITDSTDMFNGCVALQGGNGTNYDPNHVGKEYAVIDSASTPGYLTQK